MKTAPLFAAMVVALAGLSIVSISEGQAPTRSSIIEVPVAIAGALGTQIKVECSVLDKGGFLLSNGVEVGHGTTTRTLDANGNFNGLVQVAVRHHRGDSYQCHLQVQDAAGRFNDARQAAPGTDASHAARVGTSFRAEHWDWATFR